VIMRCVYSQVRSGIVPSPAPASPARPGLAILAILMESRECQQLLRSQAIMFSSNRRDAAARGMYIVAGFEGARPDAGDISQASRSSPHTGKVRMFLAAFCDGKTSLTRRNVAH
jgi:hypothetical protein